MVTYRRAAERSAARPKVSATRRGVLTGAAAFACLGAGPGAAAPARIAAIDWAMLETALAIGIAPVAASELILFRKAAVEPAVPAGVADVGLRGAISYEELYARRPDLILISPWYENRAAALSRIARVESFRIYQSDGSPYDLSIQATRRLGAMTGRPAQAEQAIDAACADLAAAAAALAPLAGREVLIMNLGDARHFRAFGPDSMFGDVLGRLGLKPAWSEPTRFGAYPTVGVEALAETPQAFVLNVGPTPPGVLAEMRASPLWRAMPPIANGRFVSIDPVNPYGALPAARRFARLAAEALSAFADG